jgi:hypothetical protein
MAIQTIPHPQAAFQVNAVPHLEIPQRTTIQGFLNRHHAMTLVITGHHGQADPLVGKTLVNFEFAADLGFK